MTNLEKDNLKQEYRSLEKVFCPYLSSEIIFNNKGFMHLLYKAGNRKRSVSEVKNRIKYLKDAKQILSITTTVQELEEKNIVQISRDENKIIKFFGFIAIIKKIKLKIVIRKENENGNYHFYSVIPHFITSPKRDNKASEVHNEKTAS